MILKRKPIYFVLLFALALLLACTALAMIEDDCGQIPCVCFLQLGDEGIAVEGVTRLLAEREYLATEHVRFSSGVMKAVIFFQAENDLTQTGTMDDDTLTLLIFGRMSDVLTEADDSLSPEPVWVPVNGGEKWHLNPICSGMEHPRKMAKRNAIALGIEGCEQCAAD